MKKFKDNYKEKFLNNLDAKNSLNVIKNELDFDDQVKVKKPRRKIILISSLSTIVATVAVILICVLIFANNTLDKNIPTYTGMNFVTEVTNHAVAKLDTSEADADGMTEITSDMPSGTEYPNITYFAKPNEDVLIAIYLDNPKQYEILSLTLNGYKYQSYQFEAGSDSYTIYVKVKAGSISGIQSYYIDQIKYIDETEISVSNAEGKDVRYAGERTIYLGVSYLNLPTLTITKEQLTLSSYLLDFSVLDTDGLIKSNTTFRAYLLEAGHIVSKIDLTSSSKTISFADLKLNTKYNIIIACSLDLLDGRGYQVVELYNKTFQTESGISEIEVEADYNSIKVRPIMATEVTITKAILLTTNTSYEGILGEVLEFNDLLANTAYELEITYSYKLANNTYIDVVSFTSEALHTKTYQKPEYTNDGIALISANNLNWYIGLNDEDKVITNIEVQIYGNANLIATSNQLMGNYLLEDSYEEVYIKVYIKYDLHDGMGEQAELIAQIKAEVIGLN